MFWKERRENKRKLELVKYLNDRIDSVKEDIESFASAINEKLGDCNFIWHLKIEVGNFRIIEKYSNEYSFDNINERIHAVNEFQNEFRPRITEYWDKVIKNQEDMLNWCYKGVPLFITLNPLWGNYSRKRYAMCYEFKKNGPNYIAYIFAWDTLEGMIFDVDPFDFSISKMTEEEFENEYIMGRMNVSCFRYENDAIEYDNSIRRLFHGQRDVID